MFWLITSNMRVHIESFEMVSINNTSNCIFNIGPSIRLKSSFIEIILILRVGKWSCIRLQFFNVFFYFISPFFFLFSLLSQLIFSYSHSNLIILAILFSILFYHTCRFSSFLYFGIVIITCGSFFYFYSLRISPTFDWIWTVILSLVKGNILFLFVDHFLLILFCFWRMGNLINVLLIMWLCLVNTLPW